MGIKLGNGSPLPQIGFGTSTGGEQQRELAKALDCALEAGYRHFDTAFMYQNERIIGSVLNRWFEDGKIKRGDVFVTKSLSNLQFEHVDMYLIHFPVAYKFQEGKNNIQPLRDSNGHVVLDPKADHLGVWKKLEEQVDAGRTRYIGLSNFNVSQIQNIYKSARIKPACLQIEIHLYLQQHRVVEFCQKHDILVVGHSPLGSGDHNMRMKLFLPTYKEKSLPNLLGDKSVNHIAQKYHKTPAQILLRFLIQSGVVPIPKSMNEERIKENIDIFDFELTQYDMEGLQSMDVGEEARIQDYKSALTGIENHPDYPFRR